jgi:hypothetical protein
MRIIGVELRLQFMSGTFGSQQQEVLLLPANTLVEIDEKEHRQIYNTRFSGTLHTDAGDFAFQIDGPQPYQLTNTRRGLNVENK